jgi:DNA-directed RNA polymerase subunit K/omega
MVEKAKQEFSKYERARILGARSLQISMDAPLLMKMEGEELENLNYDPLKMAQRELDSGVLPITVNRPMPEKKDEKLKELKVEELEKDEEKKEENAEDKEEQAENAEIVHEEKKEEVAEMKSDEEVEEEVEGESTGDDLGGAEEGGSEE